MLFRIFRIFGSFPRRCWARLASLRRPARDRALDALSRRDEPWAIRALLSRPEMASEPSPGESLLGCSIRHGCPLFALEALRLGADPFAPEAPVDAQGLRCRFRPFEAAICRDMGEFLLACFESLGPEALQRRRTEWPLLEAATHPIAHPWREGSDWFHLAGASDSARSALALSSMGFRADRPDLSGATPLLACAVRRGGVECAGALILAGCDPRLPDRMGLCPSDYIGDAWDRTGAALEARALSGALDASPASPERRPRSL